MRAFVRYDFREEETISVQYHYISVSLTYPRISYQIAYVGISCYVSIINQWWIFYIHNFLTKQLSYQIMRLKTVNMHLNYYFLRFM